MRRFSTRTWQKDKFKKKKTYIQKARNSRSMVYEIESKGEGTCIAVTNSLKPRYPCLLESAIPQTLNTNKKVRLVGR